MLSIITFRSAANVLGSAISFAIVSGTVGSVRFWCVQIEVIHDYQESRSCVSYGLEGEDSPDLLKR